MRDPRLREEADVFDTPHSCVVCMNNLTICYEKGLRKGVCIQCGFPYDIDESSEEVQSNLETVILESRSITTRHIRCIREYYQDEKMPAPLWSYSPFASLSFELFSEWAHQNGFTDMAWLREEEL
jgi:hypothetical protein